MSKSRNIAISYKRIKGFTLIELAIVIVIVGIGLGAMAKSYDQWMETKRGLITQQRIEEIEEVIIKYINLQGMLPCPSSLEAPFGSPTFGRALPLPTQALPFPITCTPTSPDPGTYDYPGRPLPLPVNVRIGAVPTAKLRDAGFTNISDNHAFDGWGRRFTFAVTTEMANTAAGYSDNDGGIGVVDPDGNFLTAFEPQTAMYTIISHGPDGNGAYGYNGNLINPCVSGAADGDNCDYLTTADTQFTHTLVHSRAGGTNQMDDNVAFITKDLVDNPKVAAFIVEKMNCRDNPGGFYPGPHNFGIPGMMHTNGLPSGHPKCATEVFLLNESFVDRTASQTPLTNGILIHSTTFEAVTTGSVYVRATIPLRFTPSRWDAPILASIYIGPAITGPFPEYKAGEVMDPSKNTGYSQGGTGVVLARADIAKDTTYNVQIYVYHICPDGSPICGNLGAIAHAGTIDLADHIVEGIVEISQAGN